ncbi:MAG: hypothetical protein ACRYF9_25970 [Janthinobacterium lividum]
MKKSHGPAFVRHQIPLTECPCCFGAGLVQGVFHQLECLGCHSSGYVHAETLEPLPIDELVIQLGMRLRTAIQQVNEVIRRQASGADVQYRQNNRRGAGGTNYTGD